MTTNQTPDTTLTTFGARLRRIREEQGLSRPDLSKLTDRAISARVIDHLESGHTEATLSRAEILANALEVEKLLLLFGEQSGSATGTGKEHPGDDPENRNDTPGHDPDTPPWDTQETGKTGLTGREKPEIPVETGSDRSEPVEPENAEDEEREGDITRRYIDEMFDRLELVDALRKDGFLKHQRKMPHLLAELDATAKYLEPAELKEIAFDRDIDIDGEADTDVEELTARVIDTAVLGADLYDVDFDVLKAFADRNDIDRPLFGGWKSHDHLVPLVRDAYRERALSEALKKSTALAG